MKKFVLISLCLCACGLCASLSAAQRVINADWAMELGPAKKLPLKWFQAETVQLNLTATLNGDPVDLAGTNVVCVWEIYSWHDTANIYAASIGTVLDAENGVIRFELTPEWSNLERGTYLGVARAWRTDNNVETQIGVLAWMTIQVEWAPDSRFYPTRGPLTYPIEFSDDAITNYFWDVLQYHDLQLAALAGRTNFWNAAYDLGVNNTAGISVLNAHVSAMHNELSNSVSGLSAGIASNAATLAGVVSDQTATNTALQSSISANAQSIEAVNDALAGLASGAAVLQLSNSVAALSGAFEHFEAEQIVTNNAFQTQIAANSHSVSNLSAAAGAVSTALASFQTSQSAVNAAVQSGIQSNTAAFTAFAAGQDLTNSAQSALNTSLLAGVASNAAALTGLSNRTDALDWQLSDTEWIAYEAYGMSLSNQSAVTGLGRRLSFHEAVQSPRLEIISNRLMTVEQEVEWTTNKVWEFGAATNWVHPSRLDIGSEYYSLKSSLIGSLWADCVFAWSAELPVQNAGATSAKWLGWEPLKTSFVQTTPAAQPARTIYQGRAADFYNGSHYISAQQLLLGGIDLYAYSTNQWTVCQRVAVESNKVLRAVGKAFAGSVSFAYSLGLNRPAAATYTPYIYINGAATASGLSHDDGQWHHYAVTWDGATAQLYADGIYIMNCNVGTNANLAVSNPIEIGKISTGYGTGYISDVMIFNRPLTTNEIWELSNQ